MTAFSVAMDLRIPPSISGLINARMTADIVRMDWSIARIDLVAYETNIDGSVIVPVSVDVVNFSNWPFASHHRPSDTMREIFRAKYSYAAIAIADASAHLARVLRIPNRLRPIR